MEIGIYKIIDTLVPEGLLNSISTLVENNEILLFDINNISNSKFDDVLLLVLNSSEFNENVFNNRLVFTLNGVNQNINDFYKWIQVDILEYVKENFIVKKSDIIYNPGCCKIIFKSDNTCTGITSFDFGDNTKTKVVTINNIYVLENIKYFTYIPIQTAEKNLVDFASNNVSFNIENIINGVSYDIRAVSVNGTSGIYTIKHILCLY